MNNDWTKRVFQALAAVLVVANIIWPPLPLPGIAALVHLSGLDLTIAPGEFSFYRENLVTELVGVFFTWILMGFWVALGVSFMRFVPVARALLLLIVIPGTANYVMWMIGDASPLTSTIHSFVVIANGIIVLMAFLPPIAHSFDGYRQTLRQGPAVSGFPFFRSDTAVLLHLTVAVLVVLVGNRLYIENWESEEPSLSEDVAWYTEKLKRAEAYRDESQIALAYNRLAEMYKYHGEYAKTAEMYQKEHELVDSPLSANALAWVYATIPDDDVRDGQKAMLLVEDAIELLDDDYYYESFLDTLAAAYAEIGRFNEAIETQKRVILMRAETGNTYNMDALVARLSSYMNGEPWRDTK